MSELEPTFLDPRVHVDWNSFYNEEDGKDNVNKRQDVYGCVEAGKLPTDYDQEAIKVADLLVDPETANCLDIGCSRPVFSEKMRKKGYKGLLFGVDPNTRQFNERPYWKPRDDAPQSEYGTENIDVETLERYYELHGSDTNESHGIILIEATANKIPLPDGLFDLVTEMFSMYHVPKDKQLDAFLEIMRLLDFNGYNLTTLSGRKNKTWMHEGQIEIADVLSQKKKKKIYPPPPLHIGFTTEDALELLQTLFNHVSAKFFEDKLVFDTNERKSIVLSAHKTQESQFRDEQGVSVDPEDFDSALVETIEKQIDDGIRNKRPMTDRAYRAVIIAGRRAIDLPEDEYNKIIAS